MSDLAQGCWEAIDDAFGDEAEASSVVLVGCSLGSDVVSHMRHLRPERSAALVITGGGYLEDRATILANRIRSYRDQGVAFRWQYTFEVFSPAFRTSPLAHWFAELFDGRNDTADAATVIRLFEALAEPYPEGIFDVDCPLLLIAGTEDPVYPCAVALHERVPGSELRVVPGAGHVCSIEQPWLFDRYLLDFLARHDLSFHDASSVGGASGGGGGGDTTVVV
jgi:pimeloyl-ACP methyl ester carboxylesterase